MVAVVIILINRANSYENWIVTAVPFAAFHAGGLLLSCRKWPPMLLHWITVAYIITINYLL